jgi:hypothetical protein
MAGKLMSEVRWLGGGPGNLEGGAMLDGESDLYDPEDGRLLVVKIDR